MRVALDTSCLVALLCGWHQHHDLTRLECEEIRREKDRLVIAVHALLECFSVLTRMPPPYRISPQQAEQVLSQNFQHVDLAGLEAGLCWATVRDLAGRGLGGGRVYDAAIARCARAAGATVLLTWNLRDFLTIAPAGLEVREPGRGAAG